MMHVNLIRPHETESERCWCGPKLLQPCPLCPDDPRADCLECRGSGLVGEYDTNSPKIIVHHDVYA